jgi:aspartate aminotransferase
MYPVRLATLLLGITLPQTSAFAMPSSSNNYLSTIPEGPPDAILGIAESFKSCTDPSKVNVCVGAYRDASGKPWILPSVQKAEERMLKDESVNKEYAPIAGDARYVELALRFAYGNEVDLGNVAGVQSLSGTGACRIGEFL